MMTCCNAIPTALLGHEPKWSFEELDGRTAYHIPDAARACISPSILTSQ